MTEREPALHSESTDHGQLNERARSCWNAQADQFNQWDALGQDEKDHLIAKVRQLVKQDKTIAG